MRFHLIVTTVNNLDQDQIKNHDQDRNAYRRKLYPSYVIENLILISNTLILGKVL